MSRSDIARDYHIEDKKFSHALNAMASEIIDEADKVFKERLGSGKYSKGVNTPKGVEEFLAESAITVAGRITERAMKSIGRTAIVRPHEPLPEDYSIVMTFNLLVLHAIIGYITSEGFDLKASDWSGPCLYFFYNFRPREEVEMLVKKDLETYVYLIEHASASIKKWHDTLMTITFGYISDSLEKKYIDKEDMVIEAFGELLRVLLTTSHKQQD